MIDGKRVLAVIPARGGSKGLPRKNVRLLADKPLVAWPISAAIGAALIDRVVVTTDDAEIAAVSRAAGAEVPFMRPPELATDVASSAAVLRHALDTLASSGDSYDYVILLEPTSPLTESADVDRALTVLHDSRAKGDAIVGVSRLVAGHPDFCVRLGKDGILSPYAAPDFRSLRRRQELEDLYFIEGSLYASATSAFLSKNGFYHERTLGFVMPRWKSFEVDDLVDLICVEALLLRRHELLQLE
jgi:N-acylneuraminate cytidylyltransferase/CMP-N,N'-diacetyllegionaminic acid synthase